MTDKRDERIVRKELTNAVRAKRIFDKFVSDVDSIGFIKRKTEIDKKILDRFIDIIHKMTVGDMKALKLLDKDKEYNKLRIKAIYAGGSSKSSEGDILGFIKRDAVLIDLFEKRDLTLYKILRRYSIFFNSFKKDMDNLLKDAISKNNLYDNANTFMHTVGSIIRDEEEIIKKLMVDLQKELGIDHS